MKLIIEGPDSVGKTTLLDSLEEDHKALGMKLTRRKMGLPEASWKGPDWVDWAAWERAHLVDRCWWSEVIYGITCRGTCSVTPQQAKDCMANARISGYRFLLVAAAGKVYSRILQRRYDAKREAFSRDDCERVGYCYERLALTGRFMHYRLFDASDPVQVRWIKHEDDFVEPSEVV
jgi:thymidylate kinase